MHDGSRIVLKKLDPDYDPTNKLNAFRTLEEARQKQQFITGLIYVNEEERPDLHELLHYTDTPLAYLPEEKLRPEPRGAGGGDGDAVARYATASDISE